MKETDKPFGRVSLSHRSKGQSMCHGDVGEQRDGYPQLVHRIKDMRPVV